MSELRRHIMMQQGGSGGYIQDGLIFWLDGINKGATDGTWRELTDYSYRMGYIPTPIVFENHGAIATQDSFAFQNTYMVCDYIWSDIYPLFDVQNYTIEMVMRNNLSDNSSFCAFRTGSSEADGEAPSFWLSNSIDYPGYILAGFVRYGHHVDEWMVIQKETPVSGVKYIGANMANGYLNRTKYNTMHLYGVDGAENTKTYIGTGKESLRSYDYIGEICAIRIYDRRLSNDEFLYNQQIDNQRFNLGL